MAQQQAGDAAKPKLSGRLLQMKFMQRATDRQVATQPAAVTAAADPERWVAAPGGGGGRSNGGAAPSRVVVLQEEDPKPGAVLGRFSFKQFNVHTERLASAAEESIARAADEVAGRDRGVASVGDAAMTAALGGRQSGAGKRPRPQPAAEDPPPAAAPFKRPPAFDGGAFGGGGGGGKTQKKTR